MIVTYPPMHSSRFEYSDGGSTGQIRSAPIFGQIWGSVQFRPAYNVRSAVACDSNSGTESPRASRCVAHSANKTERRNIFFVFPRFCSICFCFTPLTDFHCHTYRLLLFPFLSVTSEANRRSSGFDCSVFAHCPSAHARTLAMTDRD